MYLFTPLFGALFGAWEVVLVLAMLYLFLNRKRLPDLLLGLRAGFEEFKRFWMK